MTCMYVCTHTHTHAHTVTLPLPPLPDWSSVCSPAQPLCLSSPSSVLAAVWTLPLVLQTATCSGSPPAASLAALDVLSDAGRPLERLGHQACVYIIKVEPFHKDIHQIHTNKSIVLYLQVTATTNNMLAYFVWNSLFLAAVISSLEERVLHSSDSLVISC